MDPCRFRLRSLFHKPIFMDFHRSSSTFSAEVWEDNPEDPEAIDGYFLLDVNEQRPQELLSSTLRMKRLRERRVSSFLRRFAGRSSRIFSNGRVFHATAAGFRGLPHVLEGLQGVDEADAPEGAARPGEGRQAAVGRSSGVVTCAGVMS